jgi:hypothetical protein
MTITTGSRLGPYEIVAPIGAGGMGEVRKARDTRLDRKPAATRFAVSALTIGTGKVTPIGPATSSRLNAKLSPDGDPHDEARCRYDSVIRAEDCGAQPSDPFGPVHFAMYGKHFSLRHS